MSIKRKTAVKGGFVGLFFFENCSIGNICIRGDYRRLRLIEDQRIVLDSENVSVFAVFGFQDQLIAVNFVETVRIITAKTGVTEAKFFFLGPERNGRKNGFVRSVITI